MFVQGHLIRLITEQLDSINVMLQCAEVNASGVRWQSKSGHWCRSALFHVSWSVFHHGQVQEHAAMSKSDSADQKVLSVLVLQAITRGSFTHAQATIFKQHYEPYLGITPESRQGVALLLMLGCHT